MTRPPRRNRPHADIQQFLSDRGCNKLPEGVLPFSSSPSGFPGDGCAGFEDLDESNPFQIADDRFDSSVGFDCDSSGESAASTDGGGTVAVKAEVKAEPHTPNRSLAEIQVKSEVKAEPLPVATLAEPVAPSRRPFGSATEYLRVKREENLASRRQANRLSIRQLSSFLGHTMTDMPCVNLHSIQLKQTVAGSDLH